MENQPKIQKPDPKNNNKLVINIFFAILTIVFLVLVFWGIQENQDKDEPESFSELVTLISEQKVSKVTISADKEIVTAEIYRNEERDRDEVKARDFENINQGLISESSFVRNVRDALGEDAGQLIGSDEGQIIYEEEEKSFFVRMAENGLFQNIFFLVLFVGVAIFLFRRISETNNRTMSFGNSKAKSFEGSKDGKNVTFKDVAGNEESKQELSEVIDFLTRPEEYIKMGAKIPRGVLLVGAPGNGKTLMAKAVAGEAKVPFFFVSGSEFVEMFVGVGAGRVRDLFKKAKKKAPCVIFIDEIDAVGRQRGAGLGGGNDEREQTLNQILVEMDGFEETSSVIIIAATNRPDVLDPALLRPGRFDRQVTVTPPDRKERLEILKIHSKNKKVAKNVDFDIIAKRTPGFSAADLMNVMNESAILAVREKRKDINNEVLREAIEKVMLGPSLKSKIVSEKQKRLTAYHEAGHALMQTVLPKARKVQKITIVPRGRAAGYTFGTDDDDTDAITRTISEFKSDIVVSFGGYVVEELIIGEVSTGASNDLVNATKIARKMVTKYGMSPLGPISFEEDSSPQYLGKDMVQTKHFSEKSADLIDHEVKIILDECYKNAKRIAKKYKKVLDQIAEILIEKEVIEYEDFSMIVENIVNKESLI